MYLLEQKEINSLNKMLLSRALSLFKWAPVYWELSWMLLLTTFPSIFLGCFSTLARFRELPWRCICCQMSQNYLNMSVWIRKFYSKLWKVCKPSSLNSPCPCSSLPAGLLPLCSQSTFPFQVLSCSSAFAGVPSLLPPTGIRGSAPHHQRPGTNLWNQ